MASLSVTLDPHIDADWFAKPLLTAVGGARSGRLPVLIESRCASDSGDRLERAIYEVPFTIDSRFLRGKAVRLRGLVLEQYVTGGDGQTRLDAAWRKLAPAPAKK